MAQIGFKTDRGKKRANNEDSLFLMPEENIYMVADGVGGHNSGEIASMTAVKTIAQYIKTNKIQEDPDSNGVKRYFLKCMEEANELIFNMAKDDPKLAGMATTVVMVYLNKGNAYFANVGDSRAYLVRDKDIKQITEDHTYVNELLKEGSITKEEAEAHPQKNMITRALGGEIIVLPDFYQLETNKDDIIILCSDGLYSEVCHEEILSKVKAADSMSTLSTDLVELANINGGNDNITIICIKI